MSEEATVRELFKAGEKYDYRARIDQLFRVFDNWQNTLTGLGGTRDKTQNAQFFRDSVLDTETLEALYHGDDLAARAVDALPQDAMKQGYEIVADDGGDLADVGELLNVQHKVLEADIWGRLYGGGAILVGATGSGQPWEPLVEERVKSIAFLTVIDRRDLWPEVYYTDPRAPKFGEVMIYRLQPYFAGNMPVQIGTRVHESRIVRFGGVLTSKRERHRNNSWDRSVLDRVFQALMAANTNWQSISYLLADASQGVIKIPGFMDLIVAGQEDTMRKRMEIVDQGRSVARALILDAAESFERVPTPFAGLPEMVDRTWQRLAAAMRMPVTKLMGMSPAGLNATGEADTRNWYGEVVAHQESVLLPPLKRLYSLLGRTQGKSPDDFDIKFPSLWQMSPIEEATRRKTIAETDAIQIDKGMAIAEEVTLSRWGSGEYSAEMQVDLATREAALKAELAAHKENAGKPDQPAPEPPPESNQAAANMPGNEKLPKDEPGGQAGGSTQ